MLGKAALMGTAIAGAKQKGLFGSFLPTVVGARRQGQLDSLLSAPKKYDAARQNPESRYATRALGSRADLGITDNLTLGASAPMRTLDELLSNQYASLLNINGRFR